MTLVLDRTIDASPEIVFSVLADIGQAVQWMPSIQRIDDMSPGAFGLGTNWLETRLVGSRTMESRVRVILFEPGRALGISVVGKGMEGQLRFTLIPLGTGTHVHYEADIRGRGVMRVMSNTISREMEEADRDLLDRLASQVARQLEQD